MGRGTIAFQSCVMSLMARIDAILDSDSFIGPFYEIDPSNAPAHNKAKLSMLRTIVGMHDWIWDTCGVGRGFEVGWSSNRRHTLSHPPPAHRTCGRPPLAQTGAVKEVAARRAHPGAARRLETDAALDRR